MERLWRLFSHRKPDGYCHQQNPSILYVHFPTYDGLSYYYLHCTCLLEKYAEVYLGGEAKSLVLFVVVR